MARFLRWILLALIIFICALWGLAWSLYRYPMFARDVLGYPKEWIRIAMRIEAAHRPLPTDTLYIGDSVGAQLRPFDGHKNLTSNGAVLAMGNYMLVHDAILHRPGLKVVQYMSVPQVLGHRFERSRSCNNFLKPFLTLEHLRLLDRSVHDKLRRRPLSYLYFLPPIKVLPFADLDLDDRLPQHPEQLSDLSLHWIARMDSLCRRNGVELILLSPPVGHSMLDSTDDWRHMRQQTEEAGLSALFDRYFRSIHYLPDSLLEDDVHWEAGFIEAHRSELITAMEQR